MLNEIKLQQWTYNSNNETLFYFTNEKNMITYILDLKEIFFLGIDNNSFVVDYTELMKILNQLPAIIESIKNENS